MIIVEFYYNDLTKTMEFENYDDIEDPDFIWEMELEREDWYQSVRNEDTGYKIIEIIKN